MTNTTQDTILVIDDEEQIRRAMKSLLSARRYQVLLADNGEDGLNVAADRNPELVILDLTLPDVDGLEVCRELRAWYRGPILILSVRGGDADKVTALDLGADDYLTKPFSAANCWRASAHCCAAPARGRPRRRAFRSANWISIWRAAW